MPSFSDLLNVHTSLDELFLEYQRALVQLRVKPASMLLEMYETKLLAHMRDEEEHMIPLYAALGKHERGGAPQIFLNEHNKIREYIALFKQEMLRLEFAGDLERSVIWLLDSQTTFKRLLVHHDARERKILYPALDEVTSASERERFFTRLELVPHVDAPVSSSAESVQTHLSD